MILCCDLKSYRRTEPMQLHKHIMAGYNSPDPNTHYDDTIHCVSCNQKHGGTYVKVKMTPGKIKHQGDVL
jgi:hypothetical protein